MKVLMFGWEFPPHISGGLGTACYGLTSGLLENGVEVIFVVPHLSGDEDRGKFDLLDAGKINIDSRHVFSSEQFGRLSYISVESGLIPYHSPQETEFQLTGKTSAQTEQYSGFRFGFSGHYGTNLMKEVRDYALVASKIAISNQFDIIHVHDWLTFPAGIEAKLSSGKPLIVHVHATEFDRSGENYNKTVYEIEKRGMEYSDQVITVSRLTKDNIVRHYGIDPLKIKIVHNAVTQTNVEGNAASRNTIKRNSKRKIVTFLGRITFQKGPEYFIDAAEKVLKRMPDVEFVMAGSGDMMTDMIKRVARKRMSSRFHFPGFLKGKDTDDMLGMSDVYVMPSVSEPFGISTLEAIVYGVPVIISKQSGVSEVLSNAIKLDFWDTDALADSICALIKHKSLARILKRESGKELQEIAWKNSATKVQNIYETLIKSTNQQLST